MQVGILNTDYVKVDTWSVNCLTVKGQGILPHVYILFLALYVWVSCNSSHLFYSLFLGINAGT